MSTLHLYPDGSVLRNPPAAGGGLALVRHNTWSFLAFSFDPYTDSDLAECKAILKSLEVAVYITATPHTITNIMLHTDCQAALMLLNMRQNGEQPLRRRGGVPLRDGIADRCFAAMIILDARGIVCEGEWVRGHSGDEGNSYADTLARFGADRCREGCWDAEFEVDGQEMWEISEFGRIFEPGEVFDPWDRERMQAGRADEGLSARIDEAREAERRLDARLEQIEVRLFAARRMDERNMWLSY